MSQHVESGELRSEILSPDGISMAVQKMEMNCCQPGSEKGHAEKGHAEFLPRLHFCQIGESERVFASHEH